MAVVYSTDSAIVDRIKEEMQLFKNQDYLVCGDYWYHIITDSINYNRPVPIALHYFTPLVHDSLTRNNAGRLFLLAVSDIFRTLKGNGRLLDAKKENRVRVVFE